jgi:hypothetical protein
VFKNRVLRKVFGPMREQLTGEWRKRHNEELDDLYCSPDVVQVIESRRISFADDVGEGQGAMDWICLIQDRNQ